MSVQRGFHSYEGKEYFERSFDKAIASGALSEEDRDIILMYLNEKLVTARVSKVRSLKLATTLLGWQKTIIQKSFRDLTYPDLLLAIRKLDVTNSQKGKPFSNNSKHDYVVILKPFLRWLIENQFNTHLTREQVGKIKNPKADTDTHHPDDILTPEEIVGMLKAATNSRDRAILAVHYECGTRIAEIARMQWRDVMSDEYGAKILIRDQKTGKKRASRITKKLASTYLNIWKNDYPGDPSGENLVFVALQQGIRPITYGLVYQVFQDAAKRAGITKHIGTHLFRASRITHLVEQGMPLNYIMETIWGNQGTDMIKTYVKINPVELDKALLRHAGVAIDDDLKARTVEGQVCHHCGESAVPTAEFCFRCGKAFPQNKLKDVLDSVEDKLKNDPETLRNIAEVLQEE